MWQDCVDVYPPRRAVARADGDSAGRGRCAATADKGPEFAHASPKNRRRRRRRAAATAKRRERRSPESLRHSDFSAFRLCRKEPGTPPPSADRPTPENRWKGTACDEIMLSRSVSFCGSVLLPRCCTCFARPAAVQPNRRNRGPLSNERLLVARRRDRALDPGGRPRSSQFALANDQATMRAGPVHADAPRLDRGLVTTAPTHMP